MTRDTHSPKLGGHELEKWCYTEVCAYHIAEVTKTTWKLRTSSTWWLDHFLNVRGGTTVYSCTRYGRPWHDHLVTLYLVSLICQTGGFAIHALHYFKYFQLYHKRHIRAWAKLSAQSRRYDAVWEMQPKQYSIVWIAWCKKTSLKSNWKIVIRGAKINTSLIQSKPVIKGGNMVDPATYTNNDKWSR